MPYSYKKNKLPSRAGGIIFDKETKHILLVLNRDSYYKKENKWGLPKGHLSDFERQHPHIGAQREILEETGIFFPISENSFSISIYDTKYFVSSLCKIANPTFYPQDKTEIIYACWFPVNVISTLNVNRTLSKLICKWKNIFPDIPDDNNKDWIIEGEILKNIKESREINIISDDDSEVNGEVSCESMSEESFQSID